ncbi:MAG: STAS domain-containing protein [Candidatus Rifleibacteriota bacterium]
MSNFSLTTDKKDDIYIIRSNGYVDDIGGEVLFDAVQKALPEGYQKFILNLSKSPVINSQGIAQIIEISEIIVDEKSGDLAFVGLSELTMGVFKMVGLLQMGNPYPDEEEAIKDFSD